MSDAIHQSQITDALDYIDATARSGGEIVQLPDGRAGVRAGLKNSGADEIVGYLTNGHFKVTKATGFVAIAGFPLFWDRSANSATYKLDANTGDFYLGVILEDQASTDLEVLVDLNAKRDPLIAWGKGIWDCVAVKTAGTVIPNPAAGLSGTDPGGSNTMFSFSATSEAQKVDAMSRQSIPVTVPFIARARLAIYDIGDNAALDINIGVANGTHATDADTITESVFFHLDGNSLNINAESDDGTTEVTATDTTKDAVDDTSFEVWIDARDLSDIQLYHNGALVLTATTFTLAAATGPLKAIFHMEKTANDTLADVRIEDFEVHTCELE